MNSVFIIINEWVGIDGAENSEVVDGKFFTSENDAWMALSLVAESYHQYLDPEANNLVLEDHSPHLQYEEYYIQELTKSE